MSLWPMRDACGTCGYRHGPGWPNPAATPWKRRVHDTSETIWPGGSTSVSTSTTRPGRNVRTSRPCWSNPSTVGMWSRRGARKPSRACTAGVHRPAGRCPGPPIRHAPPTLPASHTGCSGSPPLASPTPAVSVPAVNLVCVDPADVVVGLAGGSARISGSADALHQRDDDPLRAPDIRHLPNALVLPDAPDQPEAVLRNAIDGRLQVRDLEGNVAQSQFVGGRGRRTRQGVGPDEARELQSRAPVRRLEHEDLAARVGNADDRVQKLALDEHPALDLQAQRDEERRHRVGVCDSDADVVEAWCVRHVIHPPDDRVERVTAPRRTPPHLPRCGRHEVTVCW